MSGATTGGDGEDDIVTVNFELTGTFLEGEADIRERQTMSADEARDRFGTGNE